MFEGLFEGGVLINKEDFIAAALAAVLVAGLTVFFQKTAIGRALRAVADDHQAAQSVGIPLNKTWVIVWCVAGLVAWWPASSGARRWACSSRSSPWRCARCRW